MLHSDPTSNSLSFRAFPGVHSCMTRYVLIVAQTSAQSCHVQMHDVISVACGQVSPYPSDCEMQTGLESNVNWERNKAAVWWQAVGNARTRKLAARERQLRSMILAQNLKCRP